MRIAAVFALLLFCNSALTDEATATDDASVHVGQPATAGGEAGEDELPALSAERAMELDRKWTAAGKPDQAFRLLRLVMQAARDEGDIDTTDIRFLAAQSLLKMGRPVHAAVILGQLAEERPELNRVRLDYPPHYFHSGATGRLRTYSGVCAARKTCLSRYDATWRASWNGSGRGRSSRSTSTSVFGGIIT